MDLCHLSATELQRRFRNRDLSPVDLMTALARHQETVGDAVNAFADQYWDEAFEHARTAESLFLRSPKDAKLLTGLPVAIKDESAVAGKRTTEGSLLNTENVEAHDDPAVGRLRAAGAIFHARTTAPEFCCAPVSHSSLWGITRNPWNLDYAPGGSSAGAGAALAAGLTPLADGSDIGGSIRNPAAYCGVVGYKPPYGRVPAALPYALDTYNHQGALARTVEDCALLTRVMSGQHPSDPVSSPDQLRLPDFDALTVEPAARGLRIALSADLGGYTVDDAVRRSMTAVETALAALGASVHGTDLSWDPLDVHEAMFTHFESLFAADVREHISGHEHLITDYTQAFLDESAAQRDTPLSIALTLEQRLYQDLERVFANADVLICPTNAAIGFRAGESYIGQGPEVNGIPLRSLYDAPLTTPFNLTSRCPVLTVPVGLAPNGVPIGVQIVGRPFDDYTVFLVGWLLERLMPAAPWPFLAGNTDR